MQVEVSSSTGSLITDNKSSNGMIIDFKALKEIVKSKITDKLDHSFVYWKDSDDGIEHQIAEVLRSGGRKVVEVAYRPTAEEMVFDFYNILSTELNSYGIDVKSIKLWETPTSFAEIRGE